MLYQAVSFSCASRTMLIRTIRYTNQRLVALPLVVPSRIRLYLNCVAIMAMPRDLSNFLCPLHLTDHHHQIKPELLQYDSFMHHIAQLILYRRHLTWASADFERHPWIFIHKTTELSIPQYHSLCIPTNVCCADENLYDRKVNVI